MGEREGDGQMVRARGWGRQRDAAKREDEGGCMRRMRPREAGRKRRSSGGGKTISLGKKSGGCGEKSVAAKKRNSGGP